MSADVVALCVQQPDVQAVLSALLAAGPQLRVQPVQRGGLVQLCDDDGRPLVAIEGPTLVQVPGEAQRLLDAAVDVPSPVWWVETRDPGGHPEAAAIARRLADALVEATGGRVWSSR